MAFNPATDFLGLWRNIAGQVSKLEMPGLDYVVAALSRAGVISLAVSATAPVANQSTTAWLQAAVPSYSAEGVLFLWNGTLATYQPATAALFLNLLQATAGQNGVSWWTSAGGPPLNTVGNNGDFAVRTDTPNGVYGPKAVGAWPANPIPGTADVLTSSSLDNTFGGVKGELIYRDAVIWQSLAIGAVSTILTPINGIPAWETLSALLDTVFGTTQGAVLYRDVALWEALAPGTANNVLTTNGPGADPTWTPKSSEFTSGTVMVFQQSAAPAGWTKQTAVNDYGLRVVSGAVGTTPGSAFSTVFAQTAVGNTTTSLSQTAPHAHNYEESSQIGTPIYGNGALAAYANTLLPTDSQGGGSAHTHSVNLSLAYTDVIIASKN